VPTRVVVAVVSSVAVLVAGAVALVVVTGQRSGSPEAHGDPSRLPVGGVKAAWELSIGEYTGTAMDVRSGSIALTDLGIGPDAVNHVEVVDAATGRGRWSIETRADWMTNADGTLTATGSGIGFLSSTAYGGGNTVQAVRLSSGDVVWENHRDDGYGASAVGGLILLNSQADISALDPDTGAKRWQWAPAGDCGEYGPQLDTSAPGMLIVQCGERIERVDLRSGASSWQWSAADGCELRDEASSAQFVGVVVTCGQEQKVHALDAATGKESWSGNIEWDPANADPGDPGQGTSSVEMITAAGTSLTMTDGLLWGPAGKLVRLDAKETPVDGGAGPDGVLLGRADGKSTVLTLLDPASGVRRWERAIPFSAQSDESRGKIGGYALRASGERYYLIGEIPGIWPGIIGLIDARSGHLTLSATGRGNVETIGVGADGTIYATFGAYGKSRLTALRVTGASTGFLGTKVDAKQWPDACSLLPTKRFQAAYPRVTPAVRPLRVQLPEVEMPLPVSCRYIPPSIHGTEVTVTVAWLADDAATANHAAKEQDPDGREPAPLTVGTANWPALRWVDTNTGVDPAARIRVSFAVGRCVADVETLGDSKQLPKLASTVADNLASSAGCAA